MSNTDAGNDDTADDEESFLDILPSRARRGSKFDVGGSGIKFPLDLSSDECIKFEIFKEYIFDRTEETESATIASILLPMPQNLITAYTAKYTQEEMGFVGMTGAQVATGQFLDKTLTKDNLIGGGLNLLSQASEDVGAVAALGGVLGNIIGARTRLGGARGAAVGAAFGAAAAQAAKGAMFGQGIARNPQMAQVFQNVEFRTHTFQYKFAPKSLAESNQLRTIARLFKTAMHPTYFAGNHFFDYPYQFDIDVLDGEHDYLFDIAPSVLTNFSFDPTPNGPSFHYEGNKKIPVAVAITMSFTELKIITQDEIVRNNY